MGLLCPTTGIIATARNGVKPLRAVVLAPHALQFFSVLFTLLAFALGLVPFRLLVEDIHEVIHEIWMLVIYTASYRQMSPVHSLAHLKQANRRTGTSDCLSLHIQINLLYEFFCCSSRLIVSDSNSSRRLISSRIISDVISLFIQGLAR